jgi:hypothetical protein
VQVYAGNENYRLAAGTGGWVRIMTQFTAVRAWTTNTIALWDYVEYDSGSAGPKAHAGGLMQCVNKFVDNASNKVVDLIGLPLPRFCYGITQEPIVMGGMGGVQLRDDAGGMLATVTCLARMGGLNEAVDVYVNRWPWGYEVVQTPCPVS